MNSAFRNCLLIAIIVMTNISANANTDYVVLEGKAERFYDHQEWSSALAMYQLMLDKRPTVIPVYAQAIVASGMMGKSEIQFQLKQKTEEMGLPIDSIFAHVSNQAFAIAHPEIYENFLILIKGKQHWLIRAINAHLLKYYTFRNDPDKMIETAEMLLKTTPENILYLKTMGNAYCLKGELAQGMEWYKKVLEYDSKNYIALLTLGNYYNIEMQKEMQQTKPQFRSPTKPIAARPNGEITNNNNEVKSLATNAMQYLTRAYTVNPTPYVNKMITTLNAIITPPHQKKHK